MSPFTVLVIGPDPEKQLAPFQENDCGTCPPEYLVFNEVEAEHLEDYNTKGTKMVLLSDGSMSHAHEFDHHQNTDIKPVMPPALRAGRRLVLVPSEDMLEVPTPPKEVERKEMPFKEIFPTFELFMEGWCGHRARDSKAGKYGYWENPNRKWDWYQLGGRWTGHFWLKPGCNGVSSPPSRHDDPEDKAPEGTADQAIKGAIDFERMRNEAALRAGQHYDLMHSIIAGRTFLSWNTFCDAATADETLTPEEKGEKIKAAREEYWGQQVIQDLSAHPKHLAFDDPTQVLVPRDEYLQAARDRAISTFAVIKDGQWYEKGSMGWWGMVSDEEEEETWNKEFGVLLDSLTDDTLLSVYDCHI